VPLDTLLRHVPVALHSDIRRSRHVATKSNTIVVQADDSRKQSDNAQSCYRRLYQAIAEAAQRAVPSETSAEQAQRVKLLYVVHTHYFTARAPFPRALPTARKLITS